MEPFLQMIMALLARNQQSQPFNGGLGNTQWQNPGFGNIPQSPYQFPKYTSPYTTGFGSPGGDVMGGIPNNIPTGQPPMMGQLPRQQGPRLSGPVGMGQGQGQPSYNGQLPGYSAQPSPQIDYRNGMLRTGGPQISRMTAPFSVR
jgi:hypothetical protein